MKSFLLLPDEPTGIDLERVAWFQIKDNGRAFVCLDGTSNPLCLSRENTVVFLQAVAPELLDAEKKHGKPGRPAGHFLS
jgi:hypothetical protein